MNIWHSPNTFWITQAQIKDFYHLISFVGLSFQQFVWTNATQWIQPLLWQDVSMYRGVPQAAFTQTCRGSWWRLRISLGWSLWPSGQWRSGSPAHDTGTETHRAQLTTPHKQSRSLYCQGSKFPTAGMAWTEKGLLMWLSSSTDYLLLNLHTRVAFL